MSDFLFQILIKMSEIFPEKNGAKKVLTSWNCRKTMVFWSILQRNAALRNESKNATNWLQLTEPPTL